MRTDARAAARALDQALRQLATAVVTLRGGLREQRAAFVSARASKLEQVAQEHGSVAAQVQQLELEVANRRAALCEALEQPPEARLTRLLARLPAELARSLRDAAHGLRQALQALRVESTVGARLLGVAQQAQEGLVRATRGQGAARYDRHARCIKAAPSGEFVRGTI